MSCKAAFLLGLAVWAFFPAATLHAYGTCPTVCGSSSLSDCEILCSTKKVTGDVINVMDFAPSVLMIGTKLVEMNQCPESSEGIDPMDPEFIMFRKATQEAIQCALYQSTLHDGMTVYFPPGRYCVDQTIVLSRSGRLRGESHIGAGNSVIESYSPCYIFQFTEAQSGGPTPGRAHIQGLSFRGANILDLRANSWEIPAAAQIMDCVFSNKPDLGSGVAVHIINHDFSNIERCRFAASPDEDIVFPVRISGWIAGFEPNSKHKATTQVKVADSGFGDTGIGISIELVDSIKILGNDFAGTRVPIDLGGTKYFQRKNQIFSDGNNNYKRNQDDPATWPVTSEITDDFGGTGWFSNVDIRDNHMEGIDDTGILVDGVNLDHRKNHSVRIESNSIQTSRMDAVMIDIREALGVSTYNNELLFKSKMGNDLSRITGIRYQGTLNCRFLLDHPYTDRDSVAQPLNAYVSGGQNRQTLIWKGHANDVEYRPSRTVFAGGIDMPPLELPAVGPPPDGNAGGFAAGVFENAKLFSGQALRLGPTDEIDLGELDELDAGILFLQVRNSIGYFNSVYAVGREAISRISTDQFIDLVYLLKQDSGHLIYQQVSDQYPVDTYIRGVFIGIRGTNARPPGVPFPNNEF